MVFFKLAGGNAANLTTTQAPILIAISLGAVFMGAMTYIGNGPNLMVRAIAAKEGVNMPSFGGYIVWACCVLLPILAAASFLFLR